MKRSIFLFFLGIILFVCQTKASTINDVSAVETEMINFSVLHCNVTTAVLTEKQ